MYGAEFLRLRNSLLPLAHLDTLLGLASRERPHDHIMVVCQVREAGSGKRSLLGITHQGFFEFVLSSAARSVRASATAVSFAQKCMKKSRGCSFSR